MAKASGQTRRSDSDKPKDARRKYLSYSKERWEHTYYNPSSSGYVVTELGRIAFGQKNKQEKAKFDKEQRMCRKYADFGFQIEHLSENPGIPTHDVNVVNASSLSSIVLVNGQKGDLKSLSSGNNVYRHGMEAIKKQGAEIVLFEFTARSAQIRSELNKLSRKNVHGFYYFMGEDRYYSF